MKKVICALLIGFASHQVLPAQKENHTTAYRIATLAATTGIVTAVLMNPELIKGNARSLYNALAQQDGFLDKAATWVHSTRWEIAFNKNFPVSLNDTIKIVSGLCAYKIAQKSLQIILD